MKKLFVLFALLAFSVSVMAQRAGSTTVLQSQENTKVLTMTAADTVTQHATVYWTFNVNKPKLYYFAFSLAFDSAGTLNGKSAVDIQGSHDATNWIATSATQVRPGGTTTGLAVDTVFYLGDVSTGVLWKYLRVKIASSASLNVRGFKVSGISLKVGEK
jgi:hypothetical protein